jgi:P27 family predicted phage terminase small subunit
MNKKPPELHLIDGTKPRGKSTQNLATIPDSIKKRIPKADWLDNPEDWDKDQFITETAEFLFEVYGIGSDQDKHTLSMLADHIETYVKCTIGLKKTGIVTKYNGGQNIGASPFLLVRNKTTTLIIQLMNELGLTPRGRLSLNKASEDDDVAKFLRGPKG